MSGTALVCPIRPCMLWKDTHGWLHRRPIIGYIPLPTHGANPHSSCLTLSPYIYLSAGSRDAPTRCPQRSLGPAQESSLFPVHRERLRSYRTSGSPHPSGWTHSQPTSPNPERGFLSTAGGLREEIKSRSGRSGSKLIPKPQGGRRRVST